MFGKKIKRELTRAGFLPGDSFVTVRGSQPALKLLKYTDFDQFESHADTCHDGTDLRMPFSLREICVSTTRCQHAVSARHICERTCLSFWSNCLPVFCGRKARALDGPARPGTSI
jgi:hypothetical protein